MKVCLSCGRDYTNMTQIKCGPCGGSLYTFLCSEPCGFDDPDDADLGAVPMCDLFDEIMTNIAGDEPDRDDDADRRRCDCGTMVDDHDEWCSMICWG